MTTVVRNMSLCKKKFDKLSKFFFEFHFYAGTHTWAVCRYSTKKNATKKNREDPSNPNPNPTTPCIPRYFHLFHQILGIVSIQNMTCPSVLHP